MQAKLTQAALAARMGISREEVNGMEAGRRSIGARNADRAAKALGGAREDYLTRPPAIDGAEVEASAEGLRSAAQALAQVGEEAVETLAQLRPLLEEQKATVAELRKLVAALRKREAST